MASSSSSAPNIDDLIEERVAAVRNARSPLIEEHMPAYLKATTDQIYLSPLFQEVGKRPFEHKLRKYGGLRGTLDLSDFPLVTEEEEVPEGLVDQCYVALRSIVKLHTKKRGLDSLMIYTRAPNILHEHEINMILYIITTQRRVLRYFTIRGIDTYLPSGRYLIFRALARAPLLRHATIGPFFGASPEAPNEPQHSLLDLSQLTSASIDLDLENEVPFVPLPLSIDQLQVRLEPHGDPTNDFMAPILQQLPELQTLTLSFMHYDEWVNDLTQMWDAIVKGTPELVIKFEESSTKNYPIEDVELLINAIADACDRHEEHALRELNFCLDSDDYAFDDEVTKRASDSGIYLGHYPTAVTDVL